MDNEQLNQCVRSEISAIETYQQALDKHRQEYAQHLGFQQLSKTFADHQAALLRLRKVVGQEGGTTTDDSGVWGAWAKTVMGAAKLFGDKAALKALKEGEESGLKEYEGLLDDARLSEEIKSVVATNIAEQRRHVEELNALIDAI